MVVKYKLEQGSESTFGNRPKTNFTTKMAGQKIVKGSFKIFYLRKNATRIACD